MAMFTPRLDDGDNEIRRCVSARSLESSSLSGSETYLNLSSRSCDPRTSVRITTRRYVDTTTYIEKPSRPDDWFNDNPGITKCKSVSETPSDIVPPLDLQSEENYPNTTRDYTFSYRKHCEDTKNNLKPDMAYETWLSAKRKIMSDEAIRRKKIQDEKRKELEDRKRLAEEKYEKWLQNKVLLQKQQNSHLSPNEDTSSQTFKFEPSTLYVAEKSIRSQMSIEETKVRLDEWERTKRLQEERRRMKRHQEEQRRRVLKEQRSQAAAEAWEKWIADAGKKPKPVPLNRGIFTLRGTISDIFVNPNEWQPILSMTEANGDH